MQPHSLTPPTHIHITYRWGGGNIYRGWCGWSTLFANHQSNKEFENFRYKITIPIHLNHFKLLLVYNVTNLGSYLQNNMIKMEM